jgi:trk system potassium uptake protein TrkA
LEIVIVGAGTVGYSLAEQLTRQNHHVSVIEHNPALAADVGSRLDVFTVVGSGISPRALVDAGLRKADMVIAVTPSDETNLLVCSFARQLNVPRRIARVKSFDYTAPDLPISIEELGVTNVIEPEKELVRRILQFIELPGVTETANFMFENVYLRGYRVTEQMPIANKTLYEIAQLTGQSAMLIVLIVREGHGVLPTGAERVLPGDEIITIMPSESLSVFRKLVNQPDAKLKKVIVFGDTLTAMHLADTMTKLSDRVILVDPDNDHGQMAASELNDVEVLLGDCTNVEVLQEVHVENAPFFIAAGKDPEDNLMSCLLAKAEGAREVIAVSDARRHVDLFHSLGLDRIVNPREITAQTIINNVIRVPIGALLRLKHVDIEVVRFVVQKNARITGKPLRELGSKPTPNFILGAVIREDRVIIPSGETVIQEGDEALLVCQPDSIGAVKKLFSPKVKM